MLKMETKTKFITAAVALMMAIGANAGERFINDKLPNYSEYLHRHRYL